MNGESLVAREWCREWCENIRPYGSCHNSPFTNH